MERDTNTSKIETFFKLTLKRDERANRMWVLNLTEEVKEFMGHPPLCQKCKGMLSIPFYICEKGHKWYCKHCQLEEGEVEALCDFEPTPTNPVDHHHICIKNVNQMQNM